jgi:hypothetical protein
MARIRWQPVQLHWQEGTSAHAWWGALVGRSCAAEPAFVFGVGEGETARDAAFWRRGLLRAGGVRLEPVGALQSAARLAHVAWNPSIPTEAAVAGEDGCVLLVDAAQLLSSRRSRESAAYELLQVPRSSQASGASAASAVHSVSQAKSQWVCLLVRLSVCLTANPSVCRSQAREVIRAGQLAAAVGSASATPLAFEFGAHPRTLWCACGAALLRCDVGRASSNGAAVEAVHRLPEGEAFYAIATTVRCECLQAVRL